MDQVGDVFDLENPHPNLLLVPTHVALGGISFSRQMDQELTQRHILSSARLLQTFTGS